MKKAFEITRIAVATVKAFVEYQLFHRNNKDEL